MHSHEPVLSRRGPAALLALLLSFLVGNVGPAFAAADFGPASFSQAQAGKSAAIARSVRRDSEEEPDSSDQSQIWLGAAPRIQTEILFTRPATGTLLAPSTVQARSRPLPFRARAPPAA